MKIPYIKIPIADIYAYLAPLDDASKGRIFNAVLEFGLYQNWADLELSETGQKSYTAVKEIVESFVKRTAQLMREWRAK